MYAKWSINPGMYPRVIHINKDNTIEIEIIDEKGDFPKFFCNFLIIAPVAKAKITTPGYQKAKKEEPIEVTASPISRPAEIEVSIALS